MHRHTVLWLGGLGLAACVAAGVLTLGETAPPGERPALARRAPTARAEAAATAAPAWFSADLLRAAPLSPPLPQQPALPLVARNGRQVDLGGLTVAQYIAQRERAARLGDRQAIYEVYQAEALCANLDAPLPETQEPDDRAQLARAQAQQRALCANVSPMQVQERLHYLRLAAETGNTEAQIDYFMEGPDSADETRVRQWREEALRYLQAAGGRCNAYALSLLSNAYDAGTLAERDPVQVLAYGVAANAARHLVRSPEQLKDQFGDELSEADFNTALQRGAQLAARSCPP